VTDDTRAPTLPADVEALVGKLKLANGKDDCTCNVAAHSNYPADHDQYCAFPCMTEAAAALERIARERDHAENMLVTQSDNLTARIDAAEDRIAELEAALLWYADFDGVDGGHRARAILNKGKQP